MTDHHDDRESRLETSSRRSGLPSAREQAGPSEPRGGKRRGASRRSGRSRDRQASPTPVHALNRTQASPPTVEPDLVEAVVEVEGVSWVVRLLGRSGGGVAVGAPPLLLVGFWEQGGSNAEHAREALVVGQTFAGLSQAQLEAALSQSVVPRGHDGERGFFADCDGRRRR